MTYGNYPEGSMRGSGIDCVDYTGFFVCSHCEEEYELDGITNDEQTYAYASCPDCNRELEVEVPSREDLADDYWADYKEGK